MLAVQCAVVPSVRRLWDDSRGMEDAGKLEEEEDEMPLMMPGPESRLRSPDMKGWGRGVRLQTAVPVAPLERRSPKAWPSPKPQGVRATGGDPCVEGCARLQTSRGSPLPTPSHPFAHFHHLSKPVTCRDIVLFFSRLSSRKPHCDRVCAAPISAVRTAHDPACRWTRHGDSWDREVGRRLAAEHNAHGRKCTPSPPLRDLGLTMCTLCCAR